MARSGAADTKSSFDGRNDRRYLPVEEANAIIDERLARRKLLRLFYALGIVLVLAAVSHAALDALSDAPALKVSRIKVEGITGPLRQEIRSSAQAFIGPGATLLNFNVDKLREHLEQNSLVGDVQFERQFPDTLVIRARKREPAALVCAGGFYLVDREGRVMHEVKTTELPRYDFPYFTGLPAENLQRGEKIFSATFFRALELCRLLRERNPDLYALLSEVNLGGWNSSASVEEHSLTAYLKGGAEVRLGDKTPSEILPVLDLFLQILREQKGELADLAYVDLRYRDRIFFMDRTTFLASASGVLSEAERLASEEAARLQKEASKSASKTKRLEPAPKGINGRRSADTMASSAARRSGSSVRH